MFCPSVQQAIQSDFMCTVTEIGDALFGSAEQGYSVLNWPIEGFNVGRASYRFIRPVTRNDVPTEDGWTSYITELSQYHGVGETPEAAFAEVETKIHVDFQRLQRKRPFEMTDDEKLRWSNITSVIDLLDYKLTTPVVIREIGQVSFGKIARPYRIKWLNGRNYVIEPDKVPGELMSCRPGQWIDAVVSHDPVTLKVLEIESINKISFHLPRQAEITKLWENIPKADLDKLDWSW